MNVLVPALHIKDIGNSVSFDNQHYSAPTSLAAMNRNPVSDAYRAYKTLGAGGKQSGGTDVVPPELAHLVSLRPLETENLSTASARDHDKTSSNNSQVWRLTFHTTPSAL